MRRVSRGYNKDGIHPVVGVAFVNLLFLVLMFSMLAGSFVVPAGVDVQLPKVVTSQVLGDEGMSSITITAENVLYLNNKVTTLEELKRLLVKRDLRKKTFLLKPDRRASMGRVIDVFNVCRSYGVQRVHVVAANDHL